MREVSALPRHTPKVLKKDISTLQISGLICVFHVMAGIDSTG